MATRTWRVTAGEMPGRGNAVEDPVYVQAMDEVVKKGYAQARVEVDGRKAATIVGGLKAAIRGNGRFQGYSVHLRKGGSEVWVQKSAAKAVREAA